MDRKSARRSKLTGLAMQEKNWDLQTLRDRQRLAAERFETAATAASELAREIARFPQICLRADRRSAYEQWSHELPDALVSEFAGGMQAIESGEAVHGARRFAAGRGRGGDFEDI